MRNYFFIKKKPIIKKIIQLIENNILSLRRFIKKKLPNDSGMM